MDDVCPLWSMAAAPGALVPSTASAANVPPPPPPGLLALVPPQAVPVLTATGFNLQAELYDPAAPASVDSESSPINVEMVLSSGHNGTRQIDAATTGAQPHSLQQPARATGASRVARAAAAARHDACGRGRGAGISTCWWMAATATLGGVSTVLGGTGAKSARVGGHSGVRTARNGGRA